MDKDISTEQKTWEVHNFGKRNVFRLDLNESREGFCRRDNTTTATTTTITATTNNNNGNGSLEPLTCTYPQRFTFFKCTCFQNYMFSRLNVYNTWQSVSHVMPVLNWANCLFGEHTSDCSMNYIRLLIKFLVRRTCFG